MKIWNNELITVKGKSLFFEKWLDHGLMYLSDLFDSSLRIYSYDSFFSTFNFTIKCKEFSVVTNAIPSGLIHLMCSHLTYYKVDNKDSNFLINGKNVFDKKFTNKDIRQVFNEKIELFQKEQFIGIPF